MRKCLVLALAVACLAGSSPALARKAGSGQQETLQASSPYDGIIWLLSFFGIRR